MKSYSYLVTICTYNFYHLLGTITFTDRKLPYWQPTLWGREAALATEYLKGMYQDYRINDYVIMPNHVHLIITSHNEKNIHEFVLMWKQLTAKRMTAVRPIRHSVWERKFTLQLLRSEKTYKTMTHYVRENPSRWEYDKYYLPHNKT